MEVWRSLEHVFTPCTYLQLFVSSLLLHITDWLRVFDIHDIPGNGSTLLIGRFVSIILTILLLNTLTCGLGGLHIVATDSKIREISARRK
jgi:hypothetical protein